MKTLNALLFSAMTGDFAEYGKSSQFGEAETIIRGRNWLAGRGRVAQEDAE